MISNYWWPRRKDDGNSCVDNEQTKAQLPDGGHSDGGATVQRRIHIIGIGNIGELLAHSLVGIPNPPSITLLLHRPYLMNRWREEGQAIKIITNGYAETRRGYDVELAPPICPSQAGTRSTSKNSYASETKDESGELDLGREISNLIVTTKAQQTVLALSAVKDRLTRASTILFLQNGMGVIEEVNEKLFPNIETRPNYIIGITTHGVYPETAFSAVHAGFGTIALALISRYPLAGPTKPTKRRDWAPSSRYLLRTITRTPVLAAVGFSETDMMQQQLEKVAINAIINPLTVMFDCHNGDLLYNYRITRTMRLLLSEISLVVRSLPELQGLPNIKLRFAPDRLETLVVALAGRTSNNVSSMLQDVRKGRETEIDFINGYLVNRGEQMGMKCVMNYMLMQMVKGKKQMVDRDIDDFVPFELRKGTRA
ncbi:MAG: hypothetical protein M1812_005518 [Candelaria pacifica]|nr:MAG: hypothetical protein M1812_005518 [Candelaria pacifica]